MSQRVVDKIDGIVHDISKLVKSKGFPELPVDRNPPFGDFALICFPAAKSLKRNPNDISEEIGKEIQENDWIISAKNENGYCNVSIDWNKICVDFIDEISKSNYGKGDIEPKNILIEHTSANPTGPFHMGRARNPIIGDSIARLLGYYGHNVSTCLLYTSDAADE